MSLAVRALSVSATPIPSSAAVSRGGLDEVGLSALQTIGTVAHFGRNGTIFSEGDDANYSYRIVSGTVRLCKLMSDGRRQIAEFVGSGDFVGIEWLDTHAFTAEALTDVVAVRYARSRLDRLGEERSDVQRSLMAVLSRDLWVAQNHLVMLGRQTAKERVVSFVLALTERHGVKNGGAIEVPMGRQDIADYLGLTIETVCRAISELKRARLIDVPNRTHIVIRNLEKLQEIAEGDL
ncbi:MAG TPA: helix-turn-helix domain-containing protein [Rhizomicrobium sp.]|nr:helix-turn-helix domain-containing protein [Rhizomicrobium sp.]